MCSTPRDAPRPEAHGARSLPVQPQKLERALEAAPRRGSSRLTSVIGCLGDTQGRQQRRAARRLKTESSGRASLRPQGFRPFPDRIFTAVNKAVLRVILGSLALASAFAAVASAASSEQPRVRAIELANDINPVTADYVTRQLDRRAGREVLRRRHRPRHARRARRVDAQDRPGRARVEDPGVRLRRARRGARRLGRSLDRAGRGHPRSGAADEHRVVDTRERRRGHPEDLRRKVVNDAAASLRALAKKPAATSAGRTRRFARRRTSQHRRRSRGT